MQVRLEPLDSSKHDRTGFSCGHAAIDDYLRHTAQQAMAHYRAITKVAVESANASCILGFYTLCQHEYRDSEVDETIARRLRVRNLKRIPMVLLAQLAVANEVQRRGLGKILLQSVFSDVLAVAAKVGAVALLTDPIDNTAADYYKRAGFLPLPDPLRPNRLFLATKTIAAEVAAIVLKH